MNENKRCINCRFCRKLKELVNGTWVIKSCCTFFPETEPDNGYGAFAIVVDKDRDRCECFSPREEATKKLVTGGIEDVIAELKDLTQMHSIVCSPIVRKVLEDAIPKSLSSNALFFSTPLLNNTDSIYVFDGDISDPSSYILPTKIPMTFGGETEA